MAQAVWHSLVARHQPAQIRGFAPSPPRQASFSASSPATSISGLTGYIVAFDILSEPVVLRVLKTEAPGAQLAICLAAEVSNPRTSCRPSGPMPSGFVQSITILFARLPRLFTASSVLDQGVAITTISAAFAASAGGLIRSFGRPAYLGSAAFRMPQTIS